jgi:phytanoyl-CoA hydroxylase
MNDLTKEAVKVASGVAIEAEQEFGSFLSGAHKDANVADSFPFKEGAAYELTEEQKAFFNENGYLIIKGLLSKDKIDKYTERLIDVCNGDVEPAKNMLVMKDVMIAKGKVKTDKQVERIQKLQDVQEDQVFRDLLTEPEVLDVAENFCGKNMKTIHNMVINKPPNVDGRHPFHQDQLYFPFGPDEDIIGCWIAFQNTSKENGTLAVIPGSHKSPVLEHGDIKNIDNLNLAYFGALGEDIGIERRVHVVAEPGDALFFHTHLLHGAGRNRSEGFRRVYIVHYASSDCRFRENGEAMAAIRHYTQVRGDENPDPKTI